MKLGAEAVVAPIRTLDQRLFLHLDALTWSLSPHIAGQDGWADRMGERHWRQLGSVLRSVHDSAVDSSILDWVPREDFATAKYDVLVEWDVVMRRPRVSPRSSPEPGTATRGRSSREVADALREAIGLDGSASRWLLDVGGGPGSLTLLLAPLFDEAVGNVRWRRLRAEELPAGLGMFRVVSFAQWFHWTDRPRVARLVRAMLEPQGAAALLQATTHQGVDGDDAVPHPRPPRAEMSELLARWLGPTRRAGHGSLPSGTPSGDDAVLRGAGFIGPDRVEVGGERVWIRTADEVVASVFSLSFAAPHLLGVRLPQFEAAAVRG